MLKRLLQNDASFNLYNLILAVVFAGLLIYLVAYSPYCAEIPGPTGPCLDSTLVLFTLFTLLTAGGLGGVVCNLRGIFKYHRDKNKLPDQFRIPFFVLSFLNSALSSAPTLAWTTLAGRIPFIGLALLAGFASQEFMERLKEVAKAAFGETEQAPQPTMSTVGVDLKSQGELDRVSESELVLLMGNLLGEDAFHWRIFQPGERPTRPLGKAAAMRVSGGNAANRLDAAKQQARLAAETDGISDWRSQEIPDWN
jgi:hypothetical protein